MNGNFSIPSNTHPVLNSDGTMNRVWYLYLQQLSGSAGAPQVSTVAAESRPPTQPDPAGEESAAHLAPRTASAPESTFRSSTSEYDTEPQHSPGNIAAIAQQVIKDSPYNSFFGASPVAQPNTTGNTHRVAAGAGAAVLADTTFDGSVGTQAYTIGDLVVALKALGLLQT